MKTMFSLQASSPGTATLIALGLSANLLAAAFPVVTFTDTTTGATASSYNVNVLRRLNSKTGALITTAAYGPQHNISTGGNVFGAFDFWEGGAASTSFDNITNDPGEWNVSSTVAGDPAAIGQLDIDLHEVHTLNVVNVICVLDNLTIPVATGTRTLNWVGNPKLLRYVHFTVGRNTSGVNNTRMADLELYAQPVPSGTAVLVR